MIGMGKARIIVKGNLFAKFMEYTDVEVDGLWRLILRSTAMWSAMIR